MYASASRISWTPSRSGDSTHSRANDALAAMGVVPVALKRAAERLKAKRRLATPRRGFKGRVQVSQVAGRPFSQAGPVRPDTTGNETTRDARWRVVVNDRVEPDDV